MKRYYSGKKGFARRKNPSARDQARICDKTKRPKLGAAYRLHELSPAARELPSYDREWLFMLVQYQTVIVTAVSSKDVVITSYGRAFTVSLKAFMESAGPAIWAHRWSSEWRYYAQRDLERRGVPVHKLPHPGTGRR